MRSILSPGIPFLLSLYHILTKMPPIPTANAAKSEAPIQRYYPIGTPGVAWTRAECDEWKNTRTSRQRSYKEEVLDKIDAFADAHPEFVKVCYGKLSHDPERYPLYLVRTNDFDAKKPSILVTGGVHGYETSGVQGALLFLQQESSNFADKVNMLVAPCVSPWAYEHIQRWNAELLDPNRSFTPEDESKQSQESKALMTYLAKTFPKDHKWKFHLDLHETTDTDATEFMPAKHAKAGLPYAGEEIPDGFYLVGDDQAPHLDFHSSILQQVKGITHIAPPDAQGQIIEIDLAQEGTIVVPARSLGLCCRMTEAPYVATTEVYPDSKNATPEICNQAQVAAIVGALKYILKD